MCIEGVPECYDAYSGNLFTLRAHVLSWSGDIPALAKVMCTMGHNSYMGCQFCYIKGVYVNRHVYYLLKTPNNHSAMRYSPGALLKQMHNTYE